MSSSRAQLSIEMLFLFSIIAIILVGGVYFFFNFASSSFDQTTEKRIRDVSDTILRTSEEFYYLDAPSKTSLNINMPDNIEAIFILHENDETLLGFKYQTADGSKEVIYDSKVFLEAKQACSNTIEYCQGKSCTCFDHDTISQGPKEITLEVTTCSGSSCIVFEGEGSGTLPIVGKPSPPYSPTPGGGTPGPPNNPGGVCPTIGFTKKHFVGWDEWYNSANSRAQRDRLDNVHLSNDPNGGGDKVYQIIHRTAVNYGVSNKIRSLKNSNSKHMCLSYKYYVPNNFGFGDPNPSRNSRTWGQDGHKVLGIAGTDQKHDYENIWGCVSANEITAFSYRLHVAYDGEIENYIYHKDKKDPCGDRSGTGKYLQRGRWTHIEQIVKVDTNRNNGEFWLYVDGVQVSHLTGYNLGGADSSAYAAGITMTNFFGGRDAPGASNRDQSTYFKEVMMYYD